MVLMRSLFITLALLAAAAFGAVAEDTATQIFDEQFRTLQARVDGAPLGYAPVISLYGDERLVVSFDELADERSWLRYSVVHCNADWQPSGLVDSEIIDGFNEADVEQWAYSRMAYTRYVHYTITLPDRRFNFKVSGNYLLRVYRDGDPDTTLLQVRFMVTEDTARVSADATFATDVDYRDRHQQLSIEVDVPDEARVDDRFNDLMVYVAQNGRLDNEVALRQPLRAVGNRVIYEHQPRLVFRGGNNYRRFETISTTVPTIGVETVGFDEPYYHAFLTPDRSRAFDPYIYDLNLHGNYVIRERESDDPDIDADYVVTHFALEVPRFDNAMVFIDGDMVNRRFAPESMMKWSEATGRYECVMLLKQGAYSYQYLVVAPGERTASTSTIEGDHYETRNDYLIKVYHRRRGERYDRLIAVGGLTL